MSPRGGLDPGKVTSGNPESGSQLTLGDPTLLPDRPEPLTERR